MGELLHNSTYFVTCLPVSNISHSAGQGEKEATKTSVIGEDHRGVGHWRQEFNHEKSGGSVGYGSLWLMSSTANKPSDDCPADRFSSI